MALSSSRARTIGSRAFQPIGCRSIRLAGAAGAALLAAIASARTVPPSFSDRTRESGLVAVHATSGFTNFQYAGGGAVGDFNRDGWSDLFVISGGVGSVPDFLFINQGDGTFRECGAEWGLTAVHRGKSACVGDFDGDGWPDLYVTSAGPVGINAPGHHKLYRNNGNGTFSNVAASAGVAFADPSAESAWTATFGDYDLDGDLDLFVGGFAGAPSNTEQRLFRNNGNGTFTDVTASIGLFAGVGPIACLSARFADMDGDRYPELLLGGDFKGAGYIGSRYFRNNRNGTFTDATVASKTGAEENGMGQTIGDFDNDGAIDWYVTSIYFPPAWTGNKLYRNLGGGIFLERGAAAGVHQGGYGWGALGVDVNHDGWEDIVETNGDAAPGSSFYDDPSYLWINNGDGTFTDRAAESGFVYSIKGRALLRLDADNDGDQDLVICRNNGALTFFRNDLPAGPTAHWLRIQLSRGASTAVAPDGIGARIAARSTVAETTTTRTRLIDAGVGYAGTSELSAHVGLGAASVVDELTITWPDGTIQTFANVAADQTLTVAYPAPTCAADLDGDGAVGAADLATLLGAWNGAEGELDGDGLTGAADLAFLLGAWGPCVPIADR